MLDNYHCQISIRSINKQLIPTFLTRISLLVKPSTAVQAAETHIKARQVQ